MMGRAWETYLEQHQGRFVEELLELLRIPSVSTDSVHAGDVRRAAVWVADRLRQAGIEHVEVLETGGHPVVYGDWLHAEGAPTVLIYGHYDVQPADPLDLWETPPFEPAIRAERVYARGASDMKANLLLPVIACEAMLATDGGLPVNVKFILEGEEEIGSPSLEQFVAAEKDRFACDLCVCADGGIGSAEQPTITVGRRGLTALEVHVRSAATDLHSGGHGGMAPNAIHALVQMLATLRDAEGRILVPGFYDQVRPLTDAERAEMAQASFDPDAYKASTGIRDFHGEPEFTPLERNWARPTLEVNGIWGGYQGEGTKTVIPCEAHAKITCRLVPDQTPEAVRDAVIRHLERVAPRHVEVRVDVFPGDADPFVLDPALPALAALERAVAEVSAQPPRRVRAGGTVPITAMFQRLLGVQTITLGASQGDERAHAPNEFVRLANFTRVQRAFGLLFEYLAADAR
ncbi:MAG: dipeptidase [Alicyclobacillus sp.]|nr:dipeptidase [Alicyclobacillus sp.]